MQKIEMEKKLILVSDIDHIAVLVGCVPTIMVNEGGEAFIDMVCKEQGVFYRVAKTGLKEERTFKPGTALNLLLKEGLPEVVTKVDREFLAPEWLHVQKNKE